MKTKKPTFRKRFRSIDDRFDDLEQEVVYAHHLIDNLCTSYFKLHVENVRLKRELRKLRPTIAKADTQPEPGAALSRSTDVPVSFDSPGFV